ncbi:MAG: sulfatase-like hydrolase/transferase, partial [Oscillospiraceae bacterium]
DHFIGDLISALSDFREPVVLVLYGDHLPSFDISDEALGNENVFQTEYVIWSNFGLKAKDQDLEAYQLSSYVIGLLGMDNGVLTKLHQTREENPKYQENLKMLEYDMLFGDMTVYGGTNPYTPTDLQMGTREIGVTSIKQLDGALYVTGKNFTPYSKVMVDGKQKETIFINAYTLIALKTVVSPGERVTVAQVSDDKVILSTTADFIALGEG